MSVAKGGWVVRNYLNIAIKEGEGGQANVDNH